MAFAIKVNGTTHSVDVDGDTPLLVGAARRARHDRNQVRLRHGALRRLHGAHRRRRDPLLRHSDRQRRRIRDHHHRGDRRDAGRRKDPEGLARSRRRAVRLLPVRPDHVRFRPSRAATRIRPMPTSTTRCPATSAAAAPMSAFAPPSSRPHNRSERGEP